MRKSKRAIKSDLTKVDRYKSKASDYDDAPELNDAQLSKAVISQGVRLPGRPKAAVTKVPVTLRLDSEVLIAFKATGPGWQTRMNDTLRKSSVVKKRA